jgi:CPA1 family monovalent cation:H+ antiporter
MRYDGWEWRIVDSLGYLPLQYHSYAPLNYKKDNMEGENIHIIIQMVVSLLFIAALVGIFTRRFQIPYTVGLVIIGVILSAISQTDTNISPELILSLLVPPLIFEAAFHLRMEDLRQNLSSILVLAIPGVVLTVLLVGGIVALVSDFTLSAALVFGALVAATDPVAVIALFRSLGAPKRLMVLLEGESLFNDGTAIVAFNIMVTAVLTSQFRAITVVSKFLVVTGGGLTIGLILGFVITRIIARIEDHLIETMLTAVLAYGAYISAENLEVSGVLAVVAAGLIAGNSAHRDMTPTTRVTVENFWELVSFLVNSLVFLLIGAQMKLGLMFSKWPVILLAIVAVLLARIIVIFGFSRFGRYIPSSWKHIMIWGGLRGAISLALALSLPEAFGQAREMMQYMAFGVVLFTLLVQGTTMKPLLRRLEVVKLTSTRSDYELALSKAMLGRAGTNRLQKMSDEGLISSYILDKLKSRIQARDQSNVKTLHEAVENNPEIASYEMEIAWREVHLAERSELRRLLTTGIISEETYSSLISEIDARMEEGPEEFRKQLSDSEE